MLTITRNNGNGQPCTLELPIVLIFARQINDTALKHIKENAGLEFKRGAWGNYEAQPTSSGQITALLLTYNFKTRYFNCAGMENELHLKFDHHIGFDVDSICFECAKRNHIQTGGMDSGNFLAC